MNVVNIHEAKTQLSKYLEQVEAGHEIIIARYGVPVAKLVPYAATMPRYEWGLLKGKLRVGKDFDEVVK